MRNHIDNSKYPIPLLEESVRTIVKGGKIIKLEDGRTGYMVKAKLHNKIIVIIDNKRLYFPEDVYYEVLNHKPGPKKFIVQRKGLARDILSKSGRF